MNRRGVEGEGSGSLIQSSTPTVACPVCREASETVSIADGPAGIGTDGPFLNVSQRRYWWRLFSP
jgi:hypothetical protein